jgi:FKBP-type peptidyl-prolyl cis-trans isomerase FklB
MKRTILIMTLGLAVTAGFAQVKKPATGVKPAVKTGTAAAVTFKNNNDSVSYAVGVRIAQSLKAQGFEHVNMPLFQKAMNDVAIGKTPVLGDAAISQCIGTFQQKMNSEKNAVQLKENAAKAVVAKQEGQAFLAQNARRPGVVTLPSGLQYEVMKAGTDSRKPTLASTVKCHYTGTFTNGTKFESSLDRGEPITFPLVNVIRGWQEALLLMTVGSKWKLYIPSDLAYGDGGSSAIGPGATLVFEVELLGIEN